MLISDDGPGFDQGIFDRLGDPFVTTRPGYGVDHEGEMGRHEGMGLGFFIAKILLEQTGGVVRAINPPGGGARVAVRWARGVIDGREPPAPSEDA